MDNSKVDLVDRNLNPSSFGRTACACWLKRQRLDGTYHGRKSRSLSCGGSLTQEIKWSVGHKVAGGNCQLAYSPGP